MRLRQRCVQHSKGIPFNIRCLFILKWHYIESIVGMFLNIVDLFHLYSFFFSNCIRMYQHSLTIFSWLFKETKSHHNNTSQNKYVFFIVKFWRIIYHTLGTFICEWNKDIYLTELYHISIFYVFIVYGYVVAFIH